MRRQLNSGFNCRALWRLHRRRAPCVRARRRVRPFGLSVQPEVL